MPDSMFQSFYTPSCTHILLRFLWYRTPSFSACALVFLGVVVDGTLWRICSTSEFTLVGNRSGIYNRKYLPIHNYLVKRETIRKCQTLCLFYSWSLYKTSQQGEISRLVYFHILVVSSSTISFLFSRVWILCFYRNAKP